MLLYMADGSVGIMVNGRYVFCPQVGFLIFYLRSLNK